MLVVVVKQHPSLSVLDLSVIVTQEIERRRELQLILQCVTTFLSFKLTQMREDTPHLPS